MGRNVRIICVVGTRPEAIKMAPVIQRLERAAWCDPEVLCTAQHREMLDETLEVFGIRPDVDFGVMRPNQTLAGLTSVLMERFDDALSRLQPHALLAQGDTTSAMVAAVCSFYHRVPLGHVEAGLRTGNLYSPFPEEMNRLVVGRIARWHFAPTLQARKNLIDERIRSSMVHVTGNTVIDALLQVSHRCDAEAPADGRRLVLVTTHRRENFGAPLRSVCKAIRYIADTRRDVEFLYPVHPNPNVKDAVLQMLSAHPRIRLVEPLDYERFVSAMKGAHFILTDSGGVQEEAPALGKPVLVLREETERPEAVTAGVARLVGTDAQRIIAESTRLLDDPGHYARMSRGGSPYGDGRAAARIVAQLGQDLAGEEDDRLSEFQPATQAAEHARPPVP